MAASLGSGSPLSTRSNVAMASVNFSCAMSCLPRSNSSAAVPSAPPELMTVVGVWVSGGGADGAGGAWGPGAWLAQPTSDAEKQSSRAGRSERGVIAEEMSTTRPPKVPAAPAADESAQRLAEGSARISSKSIWSIWKVSPQTTHPSTS